MHTMLVTYSRPWRALFQKRYWARCLDCNIRTGPFREEWEAREVVRLARLIRIDVRKGH